MFLVNLHLDLIAWAGGGFVTGYAVSWIRTRRKRRP
jgi:hypothetical protein